MKKLKTEYLELEIFLRVKKKKIIINQLEKVIFGVTIILNAKVTVIEVKQCQNILRIS